jgi:hypothetical protein
MVELADGFKKVSSSGSNRQPESGVSAVNATAVEVVTHVSVRAAHPANRPARLRLVTATAPDPGWLIIDRPVLIGFLYDKVIL